MTSKLAVCVSRGLRVLTDRGANAVGADQQIGDDAFAAGELRRDATRGLGEPLERLAAMIVHIQKRPAQQAKHALPRRRDLGAGDFVGYLAARIEDLPPRDVDAEVVGLQT